MEESMGIPIFALTVLAVLTNHYASVRSKSAAEFFRAAGKGSGENGEEVDDEDDFDHSAVQLTATTALLPCVFGSMALLVIFYHFDGVIWVFLPCFVLSVLFSLWYCLRPAFAYFTQIAAPYVRADKFFLATQGLICAQLFLLWFWSGHWIFNNILGCSLCVLGVSMIKIKNMKAACVLFACLLVYDVFWVFFSHIFFGENVMVSVAQKTTVHPATQFSRRLMGLAEQQEETGDFDLPLKIVIPAIDGSASCILGLGDMAIPEILLSFLYRLELPTGKKYYWIGMVGYTIGLLLAMGFSIIWHRALPALVFLLPLTFVPVIISAIRNNELETLFGYEERLTPPKSKEEPENFFSMCP